MLKFVKILLICLLLCGCGKSSDINTRLDNIFADNTASKARTNNYANYIDYYQPGDIHEFAADKLAVVFVLNDDSKIIMNVNIVGIINSRYYEDYALSDDGFFDGCNLIYTNNSFFYDKDGNEINYFFNLYEYENKYLMHFEDTYINIYGYCEQNEIELMALKMFNMAKSCEVDIDAVLANYSSRDVIEYQKSTVNLFETIMPVEGRIDDMMIGADGSVSDN